jgi:hypothetical protein
VSPLQYVLIDGFLSFGLALIWAGRELWILRRDRRRDGTPPAA